MQIYLLDPEEYIPHVLALLLPVLVVFLSFFRTFYQVLAVEQVSVDAKEGGNDCCIYLAVEQVYYT